MCFMVSEPVPRKLSDRKTMPTQIHLLDIFVETTVVNTHDETDDRTDGNNNCAYLRDDT